MSKEYWSSMTKGRVCQTMFLKNKSILVNVDFVIFKNKGGGCSKLTTILTGFACKTCIHCCKCSDLSHILVSTPLSKQIWWSLFSCIWSSPPIIGRKKITSCILFLQFHSHSHIKMVRKERSGESTSLFNFLANVCRRSMDSTKINQT